MEAIVHLALFEVIFWTVVYWLIIYNQFQIWSFQRIRWSLVQIDFNPDLNLEMDIKFQKSTKCEVKTSMCPIQAMNKQEKAETMITDYIFYW